MRLLIQCFAAFLLAGPAAAQPGAGNPGSAKPGSEAAPPAAERPLNTADQLFSRELAKGGAAEIGFAQMAQKGAQGTPVLGFADRMVLDHTKAGEKLMNFAQAHGIALPKAMDEEHQIMLRDMQKLGGRGFDLAYMRSQVQDHQKTAQLLEWEIGSGQNAELKALASDTLPVVLAHLQMAQEIFDQLTNQVAQKP